MDAFGIFEGGGIKGLAHIGALAAAEQREIRFIGVAGTSAGAIVAALVSVGYRAEQLYDPLKPGNKGLFDIDYLDFFDRGDWTQLKQLLEDAQNKFGNNTISNINAARLIKAGTLLLFFYNKHHKLIKSLTKDRGIFDTLPFTKWLEDRLAERLSSHAIWGSEIQSGCKVLFKHIDMPLKIIATDLTNQTIKVFSKEDDEEQSVAEAVAASISIPFLFKPARFDRYLHGQELVDGGLLSNFPAWVFDKERRDVDPMTKTFGFKFATPPGKKVTSLGGILQFAQNLALTVVSGGDHLQSRQIDNLHIIPLRVPAKTTQFDLEDNDRADLYERGGRCAKDAFEQLIGLISQDDMVRFLDAVDSKMRDAIQLPGVALRISVLLPSGVYSDRLKVIYSYNFAELDADDSLELPIGSGVAGKCWDIGGLVIGDMEDARSTYAGSWNMTKYQQALVRSTLKSCLCLPIIRKGFTLPGKDSKGFLGVLSIDSDRDLIENFSQDEGKNPIITAALDCSKVISEVLS